MKGSAIAARHNFRSFIKSFASTTPETVFIALGSNLGNRANNLHKALEALRRHVDIKRTSFLYESKPMYKTDQPPFLNAAIQVQTKLGAHDLLKELKAIEARLGRQGDQIRNGPREIDLDILAYGSQEIHDDSLTIPHPRIAEREFVLKPLNDLHPTLHIGGTTVEQLLKVLWEKEKPGLVQVTPTRSGRLLRWGERTLLMGIINATPDSFSDGGLHNTIDTAIAQASKFSEAGFDIIDIGGQSTRPGAGSISTNEELERVIPIIGKVREALPNVVISCDTFDATVAREAFTHGAEMVNDVSAGRFDHNMHGTVFENDAALVMMHMRGEPATMQTFVHYDDVVHDVARELTDLVEGAMHNGIPRWSIITDPGIGFAKTAEQSAELITSMSSFKRSTGNYPTLLGASRKSWLSSIPIQKALPSLDFATAGAVATGLTLGGVDCVRVHSENISDGVRTCDFLVR